MQKINRCKNMAQDLKLPNSVSALQNFDLKKAIQLIIGVSIVAVIFLFWLIYFKPPMVTQISWITNLSYFNALFNGLSTIFLLLGLNEIRKKQFNKHMKYMISAFISSTLFLVCYVVYYNFVGETKFMTEGVVRYIYFFILISHIILSIFVVPMILTTFFYSFSGRFNQHKKLARWTFPIWLYVSVTGVLIFIFLKVFG
jgi:putative membrane protein